jgi:hypothetical protein
MEEMLCKTVYDNQVPLPSFVIRIIVSLNFKNKNVNNVQTNVYIQKVKLSRKSMNKSNNNIEIITGDFFPSLAFVLAFILMVGAVVTVGYQMFFVYKPVFTEQALAFLFVAFSMAVCAVIWFSKKFFEFNPDTRQSRKGFYLFGFKSGKWLPLEIGKAYIAFQRYTENIHFTYGGLYNKNVDDTIFEIRIVYPDLSFKTLVSGRDFKSVAMMIQLGKILSLIYNVEFKDYVKGVIRKEIRKK